MNFRSKNIFYLLLTLAFVFIYGYMVKLIFPINKPVHTITGNIIHYLVEEGVFLLLIIIFNHFVVKQRLSFRINTKKLSLPLTILILYIVLPSFSEFTNGKYNHPFISAVLIGVFTITIGFCEEIICRGIIFPQILGTFKNVTSKTVFSSVIISSLFFGSFHIMNLDRQSLLTTVLQMAFAAGLGSLLCAFYIRSESLLIPIMIHALFDFTSMFTNNSVISTPVESYIVALLEIISNVIPIIIIAAILLRSSMLNPKIAWLKKLSGHK